MSSKSPCITLERLDFDNHEIDKHIRPISTYFSDAKNGVLIEDFCKFLSNSAKYNTDEILGKFENYKSEILVQSKQHNLNSNKLIGNLEALINIGSKNSKKFNEIRGKLFEALLIGLHGGVRLTNSNFGWGVGLRVPNRRSPFIEYIDTQYEGPKNNKKTFDVAYLKKQNNYLYECKIAPEGLGELEIGYFKEVSNCLSSHNLPYEIYLFSSVKSKSLKFNLLKKRNALKDINNFQVVGYDDIQDTISKYTV